MHIIQPIRTWTRTAALAALCLAFAACGGGAEEMKSAAAADTVPLDTSAMAVARRALGPDVRMAVPFRLQHRTAQFVAAALPVMEWVPDVSRSGNSVGPGGHELVIVEAIGDSYAVHKPGLYATREPFLPRLDDTATAVPADSAQIARMMGVADADGDGDAEVWAAQYRAARGGGHTWDVRAYERDDRTLYQLIATAKQAGGVDASAHSFSGNVAQNPAMRQWLAARVDELEAALAAMPAGGAR
ncbi:MAG TPA: hypothetical protein VGC13_28810 [Longimicrobium sp.]|jgi:hypothetical protein|uniref:hypothetical protein n=1 Tax=Longimicrobium sp. TaxID=2029185 RepID=UPI002ED94E3D